MRFGLLTQWYDPEPGPAALPGVLARGLAERGHEVRVLTGFPNYPTGQLADGYAMKRHVVERRDAVDIHRVALYPSHDSSAVKRIANYGSFGVSSMMNGLSALRGLDALWVNYSPVTVGGAQLLARHALGVPAVVHVLDLWPDTLMAGGFSGQGHASRLSRRALDAWCGTLYRAASSVAFIAPSVGRILRERGVPESRLHYVPMWADETIFHPTTHSMRSTLGIPESALVVLYAGALGVAQGVETLVDACAQVKDPRLMCLIAGSGVSESSLRQRAEGLANVRFLGRVDPRDMTSLMATADLAYIGLRDHAVSAATLPSKTQASLAAGIPILASAGADVEHVVREAGAGFSVPLGDAEALAAVLQDVLAGGDLRMSSMRESARSFYERTFSAAQGISAVEALLVAAADSQASDRRAS